MARKTSVTPGSAFNLHWRCVSGLTREAFGLLADDAVQEAAFCTALDPGFASVRAASVFGRRE